MAFWNLIGFQAWRSLKKFLIQSDVSVGHRNAIAIDKYMVNLRASLQRISRGND